MSRAFVKEHDETDSVEQFADRPISSFRNLVTASGLKKIEAELAETRSAYAKAIAARDKSAIAKTSRDLRYWTAQRASAELVTPPKDIDVVRLGMAVTIEHPNGHRQTFQIVGEDEADPKQGLLCYVLPLARELLGKSLGDIIVTPQGDAEIAEIRATSE
jgi:transcription elongation GreA/GreB family factor